MDKRRQLAALALLVTLFCIYGASHAIVGNDLLGKKYCVVGCGRGPAGIAPLGDAIKGANDLLLGPSVKNFKDAGYSIVDHAAAQMDARLKELSGSIEDKLAQLTDLSEEAVARLDAAAKDNMTIGLEALSVKLEALDVLGTKKADEIGLVLKRIVVCLALAAVILWIARSIANRTTPLLASARSVGLRSIFGLLAVAVVWITTELLAPPNLPRLVSNLEISYGENLRDLQFKRAAAVAEQLRTVDPGNEKYQRWSRVSGVLKDIYYNPASYRTTAGASNTELQLYALLLNPGNKKEGKARVKINSESDLEISFGMLTWQWRQDDLSRMKIANMMSHILDRADTSPGGLRQLAAHYLRSYLANPVYDFERQIVLEEEKRAGLITDEMDDYEVNYDLKPLEDLKRSQAKFDGMVVSDRGASTVEELRLQHQIAFGKRLLLAQRRAIASYVRMVELHALAWMVPAGPQRADLIKQRNSMAAEVKDAWDDLLSDDYLFNPQTDLNLKLSLVAALHATYARAVSYETLSELGGVPPITLEQQVKSLKVADTFHLKWLEKVRREIRPSAYKLLEYRLTYQFLVDSKNLKAFEDSFYGFVGKPGDTKAAALAAEAASKLGLFTCVKKSESLLGENLQFAPCTSEDAVPVRGMWYIRSKITGVQKPEPRSWHSLLEVGVQKPIPII